MKYAENEIRSAMRGAEGILAPLRKQDCSMNKLKENKNGHVHDFTDYQTRSPCRRSGQPSRESSPMTAASAAGQSSTQGTFLLITS